MFIILALRSRLEALKVGGEKEDGYSQVYTYFDRMDQIQQKRMELNRN